MPPPVQRRGADCFPALNASSAAIIDRNLTSSRAETNTHEDMQALMYIVCVLLFYSLGIVVGIITYLKREKQEIEESKMFDEFFTIINERQPSNNRLIKVQEVIQRLEQLQLRGEALALVTQSDSVEIYSCKNNYTSVLSTPPLGLIDNAYSVYETLNNEIINMDIPPKSETDESRQEEGYNSDADPFQNKRLSQVVAQMLDCNTDMGPEDVFDDVDGAYYDDDNSLCTDFIDYKEEPKNKELFHTQCKGTDELYDEGSYKSDFSGKKSEWPAPPKMKEFVNENAALLGNEEESSTHSPTSTTFDRDDIEKETGHAPPTGFRWSVTSV